MSAHESPGARVMGVDACKKGWIGLANDARAHFGCTMAQVVAEAEQDGAMSVIAIDIPIGLSSDGPRRADLDVAGLVGRRRSSVFQTPTREALLARTHAEATVINSRSTGKGITQQAYGLRLKILEVDEWIRVLSDLGVAGEKGAVDDVLDAGAALWTAMRLQAGLARSFPSPPERFADGATAAIRA